MAISDVIRFILPREEHFFDFLEQQAVLAHDGAEALAQMGESSAEEVRDAVRAIEKLGDKSAHGLEEALAKTFVTPLDREDLHQLSVHLDDVLDRAYACASAFVMFCIEEPSEAAKQQFGVLERATQRLAEMLPALRKHDWERIREGSRDIRALEKEGDEIYREAMRRLFSGAEIDARTLVREKEVVEILEEAIDGCEDAAEFLTTLAVKHG